MIKWLKNITLQMIAGANLATVIVMLMLGFAGRVNPIAHPSAANLGLAFPFLLAINVLFLLFWLYVKRRYALIPLLGIIVGWSPVHTYFPIHLSSEPKDSCLKVLSYNVWLFGEPEKNDNGAEKILTYIRDQKADLVCLQEAAPNREQRKLVKQLITPIYPYHDSTDINQSGDFLYLYSRYPIVGRENIKHKDKNLPAVVYQVLIDGDTLHLVNAHLQSTGIDHRDKTEFKNIVTGELHKEEAEEESRRIFKKLNEASVKRTPQAKAIARYIRKNRGKSIIVCGDFNDGSLSYTHHIIAKNLTDCYTASGLGPGISYHRSGFYVRIDNILCSDDWLPLRCRVDNSIKISDHYPIICWLKKR